MAEQLIAPMMSLVSAKLEPGGTFVLYGPYRYDGEFTTESNARFDQWLKARDARSGIRDIESVRSAAEGVGLQLKRDIAMPANNQLLMFDKEPSA